MVLIVVHVFFLRLDNPAALGPPRPVRSVREIRARIVGAPELRGILPARALAAKEAYRNMPQTELDALVAYLRSVQSEGP